MKAWEQVISRISKKWATLMNNQYDQYDFDQLHTKQECNRVSLNAYCPSFSFGEEAFLLCH